MRLLSSVALSALLFAGAQADKVIDLKADTFQSEIGSHPLALVKYFAPCFQCSHCSQMKPHYINAAEELASRNIKLAEVDCTQEAELCQEAGIRGYPTLKVFRNGSPSDYTGPRQADGIISYMIKQSLPAYSEVTADKHDEFKQSDKVVVIAYVDSESDLPSSFKSVADSLRESYLFGYTTDVSLAPGGKAQVVLYKKFDEGQAVHAEKLTSLTDVGLKEFIKENSVPLMDQVGPENFAAYAEQGLPLAYLFWDPSDAAGLEKMIERVKPVARQFKGRVNFVWIDAVKFAEHGKSLNIPQDSSPAFVIQDIANKGRKYVLSEMGKKLSADKIEGFMRDYEDGRVQPSLKSAQAPAEQDEAVRVLVTNDFDKVVFDDKKDVFIEFYAPWCGHCQRLAPIWETLAEHFEDFRDTLTIAKMDATENDLPLSVPFDIQGFPTLKFKKAGTRDFVEYSGDRSLEDLIEFVKSTSANSVEASETETASDAEEAAAEHDEL